MLLSSYRRCGFTVAALLGAGLVLSACGFTPLYGKPNQTSGVTAALSSVEVKPIPDRVGQMMRTALKRRLGLGGPAVKRYQITVQLSETVSELAIEQDTAATRANLALSARYVVSRTADGAELNVGANKMVSSYNILASDYGTVVAKADARKRAVEILADEIHARLAIYFNGPGSTLRLYQP